MWRERNHAVKIIGKFSHRTCGFKFREIKMSNGSSQHGILGELGQYMVECGHVSDCNTSICNEKSIHINCF